MKSIHYLTFAFTIFLLFSCNKSKKSYTTPINHFAGVIESYGPSLASKNDDIYVNFVDGQLKSKEADHLDKSFSIKPKVKGNLKWNNNTIIFDPLEPLKSGHEYEVTVDVNQLISSTKGGKLNFVLSVAPQDASFSFQDYTIQNSSWRHEVMLRLNDAESISLIEEALKVSQGDEEKDFVLESVNPRKAKIIIDNISDKEILNITLNGDLLDIDEDVKYNFTPLADDEFSLISKIENKNEGTINFIFNQVLDSNQNIKSLLSIKGSSETPKYSVSGNKLIIYTSKKSGNPKYIISGSLRSNSGLKLLNDISYESGASELLPKIENVGFGHIIPGSDKIIFPFEAQGLKKVRLEVFEIYSQNLQQFFQQHSFDRSYGLEYVGEVVHEELIDLAKLTVDFDPFTLKRYYLNLGDFIKKDANSIYQLRLGFVPQDAVIDCASEMTFNFEDSDKSIFESSYSGIFGYYDDYSWKDRDKPCKKGYYGQHNYVEKLVLATNVGIIAKKTNNDNVFVALNDIRTAEPLSSAEITIYNKAQRELANAKSDAEGVYTFENLSDAYQIKVSYKGDENWLRLEASDRMDLSKFDISGRTKKDGIDGFIYGERSVWRPGDTMHINFILHDPENNIPDNHPLKLTLENPKGSKVFEKTTSFHAGPIYSFKIPTSRDYNTGDYIIQANLGGSNFSKFVKIESIKPNKFAITSELSNIDLSGFKSQIFSGGKSFDINVDWLYGAPAKNKEVTVERAILRRYVDFNKFKSYNFSDPRNEWNPGSPEIIAETKTNDSGKATINLKLPKNLKPSGMLSLQFKTTAFEASGDFSTDVFSVPFYPYDSYVGIEIPKDIYGSTRIEKNNSSNIRFVTINDEQEVLSNRRLSVNIYKMERYWWWNSYNDEFDMTNTNAHISQSEFKLSTNNSGVAKIDPVFMSNGRYYVKVCDDDSGHCTGDYIYVGYVWDDEAMTTAEYEEAAKLNFTSEKKSYQVGETVQLNIPSYFNGKALVSLENGDNVVETFWTDVKRGVNKVNFTAQLSMFPTIYAHVTMLQKHSDKVNDIPIRSFGVIPINIEDESLKIEPVIKMQDELKPKEKFDITVSEDNGKSMYYTVAVVDEGLLNISRYKTPDPFNAIYSRPSLGVSTYDMYNEVMAAYGNGISKLFSIGGDAEAIKLKDDLEANRFKPVVRHIGPFYLEANSRNEHKISLPNYIGAVRVMLVAANENQFGAIEKLIPVKQDLMVLATMPRQLAPGDQMDLPVTIFGMKRNLGNVTFGVETQSNLVRFDKPEAIVNFNEPDEKVERIISNAVNQEGVENLRFYASTGSLESTQDIEIAIKNPNPIIRRVDKKILKPGELFTADLEPLGPHESDVSISASSLYPINIEDHIDRLVRYPYGCLEQRTSAAIAMLYKEDLLGQKSENPLLDKAIVQDLINDLYKFKTVNGYTLWPGNMYYDSWITSYVGDFLAQAKNKGYNIQASTYDEWKSIQKAKARNWRSEDMKLQYGYYYSLQSQAYRLFTLAQAGEPLINEMNRLREDNELDENTSYMLAAAYSSAGRQDVGIDIINEFSDSKDIPNYYGRYGSKIRNQAIKTLMAFKIGDEKRVGDGLIALNELLSNTSYLSTQTSSFVLRTLSETLSKIGTDKEVSVDVAIGNNSVEKLMSANGVVYLEDNLEIAKQLSLKNNTDKNLFIQVSRRAKENLGNEKVSSSKLSISTKYLNSKGLDLDAGNLSLGDDIIILTTISKDKSASGNFDNLALRQALPSGWEILNNRVTNFGKNSSEGIDYQDYKDNQVNSFFSLENRNQITIKILAKATYPGTFYYPKTLCESMYSDDIFAELAGFSSTVKR